MSSTPDIQPPSVAGQHQPDPGGRRGRPKPVGVRLALFGMALVAVSLIGAVAGTAIGPDVVIVAEAPPPIGEGVVTAAEGYRLVLLRDVLDPAAPQVQFAIEDQDGRRVQRFTPVHERLLHLIVVSRDLTSFHHVHPKLDRKGQWTIDLPTLAAGSYRAIADFQVEDGARLALGSDLVVPGDQRIGHLPEPTNVSKVDGYDVELHTIERRGGEVEATLTVRRDGRPVTDLQPYLGANGHLIALRTGDLAYSHVHPTDDGPGKRPVAPTDGSVHFDATLTSAGRYALFFDFRHGGVVHTASFTFDQGAVVGAAEMEH